jgi:hypothetical protein
VASLAASVSLGTARSAQGIAANFAVVASLVPPVLNVVDVSRRVLGGATLVAVSKQLNKMTNRAVPIWNPWIPKVLGSEGFGV